MMKKIPAINGEVSVADMGFTLAHEHLLFHIQEEFKQQSIDYLRSKLFDFEKKGGSTVVDVTPHRNIKWLEEACRDINLNFIVSTGYYLEKSKFIKHEHLSRTIEEDMEMMEKEISEGIGDTGIRAGIIKVAADNRILNTWEQKVFTAAAKVSIMTKTPIATHACWGLTDQQKVLFEAGADLNHVYYSHPEAKFGWEGRSLKEEVDHLIGIVKEGSYLMLNDFELDFEIPKDEFMYLIKSLAHRGYLNHILLSMDMNFEIDYDGTIYPEASRKYPETRKRTYEFMITEAVALLMQDGFSRDEIDTIFVRNPARFFNYM